MYVYCTNSYTFYNYLQSCIEKLVNTQQNLLAMSAKAAGIIRSNV